MNPASESISLLERRDGTVAATGATKRKQSSQLNADSLQTRSQENEPTQGKFIGIIYSCMQGDPSGWRELTDGFVTVEIIETADSKESRFRISAIGKGGRKLDLKLTKDTKVKQMKDTFLQWVVNKGSCLTYGLQMPSKQQLAQMLHSVQQAIALSRNEHEDSQNEALLKHRLQHLNRTGQTTEAYQMLMNQANKEENQGKVMVRVKLPDDQSTVMRIAPLATLQELLVIICSKRQLDHKKMGMRFPSTKAFLQSHEMERFTVRDLAVKEVEVVDFSQLVAKSAGKDKVGTMEMLSSHTSTTKASSSPAVANDVILEVFLPDGGKTMVKVPQVMSMGELLFYICDKRGLDVTAVFLSESSKGKSISVKGTVGQLKKKRIYAYTKRVKKVGTKHSSSGKGVARTLEISEPTLKSSVLPNMALEDRDLVQDSTNTTAPAVAEKARREQLQQQQQQQTPASHDCVSRVDGDSPQHLNSMLAEGVPINDPRFPKQWKALFMAARISHMIHASLRERQLIMDLVQQHGGPTKMLQMEPAQLRAIFTQVRDFHSVQNTCGARRQSHIMQAAQATQRRGSIGATCVIDKSQRGSSGQEPQGSCDEAYRRRRKKAPLPPPQKRTQRPLASSGLQSVDQAALPQQQRDRKDSSRKAQWSRQPIRHKKDAPLPPPETRHATNPAPYKAMQASSSDRKEDATVVHDGKSDLPAKDSGKKTKHQNGRRNTCDDVSVASPNSVPQRPRHPSQRTLQNKRRAATCKAPIASKDADSMHQLVPTNSSEATSDGKKENFTTKQLQNSQPTTTTSGHSTLLFESLPNHFSARTMDVDDDNSTVKEHKPPRRLARGPFQKPSTPTTRSENTNKAGRQGESNRPETTISSHSWVNAPKQTNCINTTDSEEEASEDERADEDTGDCIPPPPPSQPRARCLRFSQAWTPPALSLSSSSDETMILTNVCRFDKIESIDESMDFPHHDKDDSSSLQQQDEADLPLPPPPPADCITRGDESDFILPSPDDTSTIAADHHTWSLPLPPPVVDDEDQHGSDSLPPPPLFLLASNPTVEQTLHRPESSSDVDALPLPPPSLLLQHQSDQQPQDMRNSPQLGTGIESVEEDLAPPLPTLSDPQRGLMAAIRAHAPATLHHVSENDVTNRRTRDPRDALMEAIRQAPDALLLKRVPRDRQRKKEPRDALLESIRTVSISSLLRKVPPVTRQEDPRTALLRVICSKNERPQLNRVTVNAHKTEATRSPRDTLLAQIRKFDASSLNDIDPNESKPMLSPSQRQQHRPSVFDPRTALLASLGGMGAGISRLRKVEKLPERRPTLSPKPNSIMSALVTAMDLRRNAVAGKDNEDCNDDESDSDREDEFGVDDGSDDDEDEW